MDASLDAALNDSLVMLAKLTDNKMKGGSKCSQCLHDVSYDVDQIRTDFLSRFTSLRW